MGEDEAEEGKAMRVYLVRMDDENGGWSNLGVFSTKAKAEQFIRRYIKVKVASREWDWEGVDGETAYGFFRDDFEFVQYKFNEVI